MVCRHYQELDAFVQEAKKKTGEGKVADYIPALAESGKTAFRSRFIMRKIHV